LSVAVVFVLACAIAGVSSGYLATAKAAPPAGVPRWSYACVKANDASSAHEQANKLGAEGWELAAATLSGGVGIQQAIWCFKRPR
jgi:FlaG/FlaF family flagellin (archaellin)